MKLLYLILLFSLIVGIGGCVTGGDYAVNNTVRDVGEVNDVLEVLIMGGGRFVVGGWVLDINELTNFLDSVSGHMTVVLVVMKFDSSLEDIHSYCVRRGWDIEAINEPMRQR